MTVTLPPRSPTGKKTVPYEGPLDAEVMVIAESPAKNECEKGRPLVGRSGRLWDQFLTASGLQRSQFRIVNLVPVRAPGKREGFKYNDRFEQHYPEDMKWGIQLAQRELQRALDAGVKLIVPMGNNPLKFLAPELPAAPRYDDDESSQSSSAEKSRIGIWRGSLFAYDDPPHDVESYFRNLTNRSGPMVLPTYHPAAIARRFDWQVWALTDFKKVAAFLRGEWEYPHPRKWHVNRFDLLPEYIDQLLREGRVSVDTESAPYEIVALTGRDEVHCFSMESHTIPHLKRLLEDTTILKIAQNAGHDWTFFHKHNINVSLPHADVGGMHHIVNGGAIARNLSPAIATKWTTYPYHKWLVDHDPRLYCGVDTAVPYDAYDPLRASLHQKGLTDINDHDHQLLMDLLEMQWYGVEIDEVARYEAAQKLEVEYDVQKQEFQQLAEPVVKRNMLPYLQGKRTRFKKPHLFHQVKQCQCCNGAKRCAQCSGLNAQPKRKADYLGMQANGLGVIDQAKLDELRVVDLKELMSPCRTCKGNGKQGHWLEINPESNDQKKDILYKGFNIPPRKFEGKTTVRASQLNPLLDDDSILNDEQREILEALIAFSQTSADLTTMLRLEPDVDGFLHCVFDPWGTVSGRVASKEGLLQVGTNAMNIPDKHRNVIVPRKGYKFVAPDYSQIETRNVAVVSNDDMMFRMFKEPIDAPGHPRHGTIDSHTFLQLAVKHHSGIDVTRDQCKILGYGGMYGGGGVQLAREMTSKAFTQGEGNAISDSQGVLLQRLLLQCIWPGVKQWHRNTEKALKSKSRELRSPTGRVRRWPGYILDQKTGRVLKKILNEGLSYFPQDMGAYVLAKGLRRVKEQLQGLVHPCIHVHDELVLEVPESPGRITDEALEGIVDCMTLQLWNMDYPIEQPVLLDTWK